MNESTIFLLEIVDDYVAYFGFIHGRILLLWNNSEFTVCIVSYEELVSHSHVSQHNNRGFTFWNAYGTKLCLLKWNGARSYCFFFQKILLSLLRKLQGLLLNGCYSNWRSDLAYHL